MYLIDIHLKTDRIPPEQADELLQGHRAWFKKYADEGNFLVVGPYTDQDMAGLIIAQAADRDSLNAIISQDVYAPDKADYSVREFQANIIAENIAAFKGK